jgi:hypothetical protein
MQPYPSCDSEAMNEAILRFLLFFGLGAAGFCVLVFSAFYARKAISFILWGLVATGFYVLHCVFWSWLAGVGSATSGSQSGYRLLSQMAGFFAASLVIYACVACIRLWRR